MNIVNLHNQHQKANIIIQTDKLPTVQAVIIQPFKLQYYTLPCSGAASISGIVVHAHSSDFIPAEAIVPLEFRIPNIIL